MAQDLLVRRRHMRVRADQGGGAPIDEMPHRFLLRGRLGVEVDEDGVGAGLEPAGLDLPLDRAERIVEIGHEHAPLRVDHQHIRAAPRLEQTRRLCLACLAEN